MELVHLPWQHSATPPNYSDVLLEVRDMLGVDHIAYGAIIPGQDKMFTYATYPDAWMLEYGEKQLGLIDPTVTRTRNMIIPLDWTSVHGDPDFERVCEAAKAHGVPRHGITIPVRGPRGDLGLIAFAKHSTDSEWARFIVGNAGRMMLKGTQFHESVVTHVLGERELLVGHVPTLDDRELEILREIDKRGSPKLAARSLGIALRSIETHLRTIRIRLRALTDGHAIIRAKALEII